MTATETEIEVEHVQIVPTIPNCVCDCGGAFDREGVCVDCLTDDGGQSSDWMVKNAFKIIAGLL